MKTFLWTTLFWIVAAIAWLLCLGFGNLWTQVLDNEWIASVMPKNLKAESCDAVLESALEDMDWCAAAEANNCSLTAEENETDVTSWDVSIKESLENIVANQQIIYSYLQESFDWTNKAISNLSSNNSQDIEEEIIDPKEQQRLELQAQIEALQNEMNNL